MALTSQQINLLLNEARTAGLDEDQVRAIEWVLLDRAAELNGAERLEMTAQLLTDDERAPVDTFISESAAIRTGIMERGAADLEGISDEEWERLKNDD